MDKEFQDPVLGHVTWNETDRCRQFDVGPVDGCSVETRFAPSITGFATASAWHRLRSCVQWIRNNESTIREQMEIERNTRRSALRLISDGLSLLCTRKGNCILANNRRLSRCRSSDRTSLLGLSDPNPNTVR